jgi:hypothetical protein
MIQIAVDTHDMSLSEHAPQPIKANEAFDAPHNDEKGLQGDHHVASSKERPSRQAGGDSDREAH